MASILIAYHILLNSRNSINIDHIVLGTVGQLIPHLRYIVKLKKINLVKARKFNIERTN